MKIVQSMLTKNPCYNINRKINVQGLMLHSVGCSQPNANVFIRIWNNASYEASCVHGVIDANDGTIYQCLPWNHRGWHGGGSSNNTHIGVEMCEPDCIKYIYGATFTCSDIPRAKAMVKRTYDSAVELFAYLCKEYNLDPLKNIVSHNEGYKLGIAAGHVDPEHLWDGLGMGYTMNGFRKDVQKKMKETSASTSASTSTTSSASSQTLFPPTPFTVKVSISDLNYRSEPSISGKVKGQTGKGSFTITEVKDSWGKLKSGAGWIWLGNPSYTTINGTVQTTTKKTNNAIAIEVIQGKWGCGQDRKNRLEKAGYDYNVIQDLVNKLMK